MTYHYWLYLFSHLECLHCCAVSSCNAKCRLPPAGQVTCQQDMYTLNQKVVHGLEGGGGVSDAVERPDRRPGRDNTSWGANRSNWNALMRSRLEEGGGNLKSVLKGQGRAGMPLEASQGSWNASTLRSSKEILQRAKNHWFLAKTVNITWMGHAASSRKRKMSDLLIYQDQTH